VSPHIRENVRNPSEEAAEVDRFERIPDFLRVKLEKPVNPKSGSFKPYLHGVYE